MTNKKYFEVENDFIRRYNDKIKLGHCSNEDAIRQTLRDIIENLGLIKASCGYGVMDTRKLVRVEFS